MSSRDSAAASGSPLEAPAAWEAQRAVVRDVLAERDRQDDKWGVQDHDDFTWGAILGEEVGEVAQASLEFKFGDSENGTANVYRELIEVAAVALAWAEMIRRSESWRLPK